MGIEDQRFALQWIQESITAFGGDPNRVTIFGQSCGAQSVLIHLASPNAWSANLFHRAIVESAPTLAYRLPEAATELGTEFAVLLGCTAQDIPCMINKTTEEVLDAGRAILIPLVRMLTFPLLGNCVYDICFHWEALCGERECVCVCLLTRILSPSPSLGRRQRH